MREKWDLSKVSCLIAEDNPHMRAILRSVLSGFGIRTMFEASDGAEALELVVDRKPDIVLCDWVMNPFGGNEFLRILRGDRDLVVSTTPVLIVTAHAKRTTILEALEIGVHGFVAKPVSPAILYRHVGEVLERQEMVGRSKGILGPGHQKQLRLPEAGNGSDRMAGRGSHGASDRSGQDFGGLALL